MSIKQSVAHGCTRGVRDTSKEARIGSPVGSVGDTMRSDASSRERDGAPVYVEDEPSSALDGDDEQQPWVQPELYITTRAFRKDRSFIGRLPSSAKDALYTGGVCHYLALYRSERGELWQFDFGPFGGDVASRFLNDTGVASGQRDGGSGGATPGHVREKPIDEIPDGGGTYLVGSTDLTLDEIREFNSGRNTMYSVNKNDCRHYVNDLCEHGAGVENVCSKYIRGEVWGKKILSPVDESGENALDQERRRRATELAVLLPILAVTDLDYVPIWDRVGQASTAAILFGVGVRCIPPALMAAAASVAARVGGATASSAASTGATIGVAAAKAGTAVEAGTILMRVASAAQPLVAPLSRRLITTGAGVVGGCREDIAQNVKRGQERAKRALASFRGTLLKREGDVAVPKGRSASVVPTVGWAGGKLASSASNQRK